MKKPFLIALDGLDGSGKETQSNLLYRWLNENHIPCRHISFPTYHDDYSRLVKLYLSGAFGESPETVNAYAASSFFAADRYCSYQLDWKKDYDAGSVILANRYTTGNAVHQLSKLPEENWDSFLSWLCDYEFCKLGLPAPDLVFYLCVTPEIARRHVLARAAETGRFVDIHEKSADHLEKSYRAAKYSAQKLGWITVDCTADGEMLPVEQIHQMILRTVKERLA